MSVLKSKLVWACVVLAVLAAVASALVYGRARDYVLNDLGRLPFNDSPPVLVPTPAVGDNAAVPAIELPKPWSGKERVNVLLLGIDQRQGDVDPGYRTDTMMVLTLDPVTLSAAMLSIPRDLWVQIPGYDPGRINTANFLGDSYKYPGGGAELARKTVQNALGIPIHFYGRLNFTAFEDLVDRIGGVTVEVSKDIYDPSYPTENYATEVFSITKGIKQLDGATALKYARTRHGNTDFDRARRQQQVILAVREKLKDPQVLASLAAQAPEVLAKLNQSVKTNMTLDQMMQLAALAQKVDLKNIKTAVLDEKFTELAETPTDPPQQVQVPIRSRIAQLRDDLFSTPVNSAAERLDNPVAAATAIAPDWKKENARVVVLNGTLTAGLAQRASDYLKEKGFNVVKVGNAPNNRFDYDRTQVSDYTGKTLTASALADALKVPTANLRRFLDPSVGEDIVLILGNDVKLP